MSLKEYKREFTTFNTPKEIVDFWFGDKRELLDDKEFVGNSMKLWFMRGSKEFEDVFINNKDAIQFCANVKDDSEWENPLGCLARIILLDQGTRTAFRGTPRAFEYDEISQAITSRIIENDWFFEKYHPVERMFVLLPYMHSENIDLHEKALVISQRIPEGAPPDLYDMLKGVSHHYEEHYKVIKQFNRYPSRNEALVRE